MGKSSNFDKNVAHVKIIIRYKCNLESQNRKMSFLFLFGKELKKTFYTVMK